MAEELTNDLPESDSLEEHEAVFGPNGTGEAPEPVETPPETPSASADPLPDPAERDQKDRDDKGRFQKPRHRAKSQQASPEDVPRIRELTAKLRQAEQERDEWKAKQSTPTQQTVAQPQPSVAQRQDTPPPQQQQPWTPPPTRPEPSEDDIGTKYATYAAFTRDQAQWVLEQERARDRIEREQQTRQTTYKEWGTQYQQSLSEAKARYPDYDQQITAIDTELANQRIVIPQVILDAIVSSKRGPDVAYYLATHPDDYKELIRDAWPVNAFESVGMVRRVLESRLPVAPPQRSGLSAAGRTGSAPQAPAVITAPRPPNPVRTGPQKIGDDAPGDDDSLEAHEQFHYRRGR